MADPALTNDTTAPAKKRAAVKKSAPKKAAPKKAAAKKAAATKSASTPAQATASRLSHQAFEAVAHGAEEALGKGSQMVEAVRAQGRQALRYTEKLPWTTAGITLGATAVLAGAGLALAWAMQQHKNRWFF